MKKFLMGTVGLLALGLAAPAVAADLGAKPVYTKAPAMVAAAYNWSGFYLGVQGGYAWGQSDWTTLTGTPNDRDISGGFIGGTIGANMQLANNLVLGLEADLAWASIDGSSLCLNPAFTCGTKLNGLATLAPRVGYAMGNALLYVKAGLGFEWGKQYANVTATGARSHEVEDNRLGWLIGAGLEYAVMGNWTVKAEYNYMDFGSVRASMINVNTGALDTQYDRDLKVQAVKVGVNYKFGGPVVAKY